MLLVGCLEAQQYRFQNCRQDNGLGNFVITALNQTKDHFLWAGTQNGLYRYDGAQFLRFGVAEGLPSAYIVSMSQSADGTFWVHSHRGVSRYQAGRFFSELVFDQASDSAGMGIAVNSSGVVFVASRGGIHIGHKSGKDSAYQFKLHAFPAGLKPKTVCQIGTDGEGRAWFGCGDGLCSLRADGNYEFHREDLGLSSDKWNGFGFDTSGNAWLHSNQSLMRRRSGAQRFEAISTPPSLPIWRCFFHSLMERSSSLQAMAYGAAQPPVQSL